MPTHRDLAHLLGISVQTVSRAYDELIRRQSIVGEVGRGTFVRRTHAADVRTPFVRGGREGGLIDLSILKPVVDRRHHDAMSRALVEVAGDLDSTLVQSFRPSTAHRRNAEAGAVWMRDYGLDASADTVLVANGATPALTMALMTAARAGSTLLLPAVTHHNIPPLTQYLGIEVAALAEDGKGVSIAAFDAACLAHDVCALYIGPNAVDPLGAIMPMERRRALVEAARRNDVFLIENEVYGPLPDNRLTPLAALAPERTFHVTSFTKCVLPGLRIGYLVAPRAAMPAVLNRHLICDWMATPLVARIATNWVHSGLARELADWQRQQLAARCRLAREILPDGAFTGHPQGLHVWIDLPEGWEEEAFVSCARLRGVALAPGRAFRVGESPGSAVRLSTGSTTRDDLLRGLEVVASLLSGAPEPPLMIL